MKKSIKVRLASIGTKVALGTGIVLSGVGVASADASAAVTAISAASADVGLIGGAALLVIAAVFAIKVLRRAV